MARGWESKSVESQIDAAEERKLVAERAHVSAELVRVDAERSSIQLSMERIARELEATTHPRRREQLLAAMAHLQEQLGKVS